MGIEDVEERLGDLEELVVDLEVDREREEANASLTARRTRVLARVDLQLEAPRDLRVLSANSAPIHQRRNELAS